MTRVKYVGVTDAKARFERMRPALREIDDMLLRYKPFGPEYCVLLAAREAFTTAAFHFTREPFMFGGGPPSRG